MIQQAEQKNPISILNEFSLKHNTKFSFEFNVSNDLFCAKVIYENRMIGEGKDKKKQKAKSQAAESAVSYLASLFSSSFEEELRDFVSRVNKKGYFKLISKGPPYIYDYYLNNIFIAKGVSESEIKAKEECAKNALNKLKEVYKRPGVENQSGKYDRECQTEQGYDTDTRAFGRNRLIDSMSIVYLEEQVSNFALSNQQTREIIDVQKEMEKISKRLAHEIVELGSSYLKITRSSKLELDYGVIIPQCSRTNITNLFETLEQARLVYLECKEKNLAVHEFSLSMSVELIESHFEAYPRSNYICLVYNQVKCNLYVYEDSSRATFLHYNWAMANATSGSQRKALSLLRHWRFKCGIEIPVELLDLLVINFVSSKMPCGLGFRVVCEKMASGIFLPGSSLDFMQSFHNSILNSWPLEFRMKAMSSAQEVLFSIVNDSISSIF